MYHHFTNNFKNYFLKNKLLFSFKNDKDKRYKKSKQTNRKSNESYLSESHSVQSSTSSRTSKLQCCSNQLSLLMEDLYLYINTFDNASDNNTFESLYTSDTISYKESSRYECHDIIDKYHI